MTDEEAVVAMHKTLAEYHAARAKDACINVAHDYHDDLAFRLAHEAERIPERAATRERVGKRFAGT
jgi:DNA-binding SARP family transcriptional activator